MKQFNKCSFISVFYRYLFVLCTLFIPTSLLGQDYYYSDGLQYQRISGNTVRIGWHKTNGTSVSYQNAPTAVTSRTPSELVIPSLLNWYFIPIEIDSYAFNNSSLKSVVIPNTVTSIKNTAFSGSKELSIVILPSSITDLGNAFQNCSSLRHIVSLIENPSSCWSCFSGIASDAHLYVPEGTVSKYKSLNGWKTIPNIAEKTGDIIFHSTTKEDFITELLVTDKENGEIQIGVGAFAAIPTTKKSYCTPIKIVDDEDEYCVSRIANNAFKDCIDLEVLSIKNNITHIGQAFEGCENLRSVYVEYRNPSKIDISEGCFNSLPDDAILYVPAGTKEKYEAIATWNRFSQIIESGPISLGDISSKSGLTLNLPVYLKNSDNVTGIQFKLLLTDGISIVDNHGSLSVTGTSRTDGMTIMSREDPDERNCYNFILFSPSGNSISGNEGVLFNIQLSIAEDVEIGKYELSIEDVYMTTSSFETLAPSDAFSELTINDITKGDINCEGNITAQDASLVLQLVAKKISSGTTGIVYEAADVNGDGQVTAQDASLILQYVAKKITW